VRSWLAALAVLLGAWGGNASAQSPALSPFAPLGPPKVQAELAPESAAAVPGGVIHVGLRQQIAPGWHTYWRNPGDSGEPTRVVWTVPQGWSAGEIVWPTPSRHRLQHLVNYGYTGEVFLPVPIHVPASARPGETVTLRGEASWLVCETICIPKAPRWRSGCRSWPACRSPIRASAAPWRRPWPRRPSRRD
jgi:thiol:disulfide interchange protein DsbD